MDPQTMLIGAAVFVISAILIYLISAFTMKEKTFEEVIEEQRRRQEEEREKQKNEKKSEKENKKKYRKGKEKPKEKSEKTPSDNESQKDQKMVNLEIDPEIIEPVESVALNSKKSKNKKAKSILVNKDEKSVISENKQAKEIVHKDLAPKDEVELHHEQHRKDKHQAEQTKASKKQEKAERIEKERSVKVEKHTETVVEVQRTRAVISESETKSARAKGGVIASDAPALNGSKLIASVKAANLKDSEIQTLIEILLNRQGISTSGAGGASGPEWNKKSQKGDPMMLLKRQLEEKERALQEEQNIAMSATSRVKELRQEFSSEKVKFATLEKRYQEKIAVQNQEIEALHARMQNTHQQHMKEIESMQTKMTKLESATDKNLIKQLQDEKKILTDTLAKSTSEKTVSPAEMESLKKKVQIIEKELSSNTIKLAASENAKKSLELKVAKYEEQLKKVDVGQKDVETVLNRKMDEVNQELRRAEARNESLASEKKKASTDLAKANDALNTAQKEVSTLKSKLQELEKHLSANDNTKELEAKLQESERKRLDLEGNLKNLEKQLKDSSSNRSELETELQSLRQANYALKEEMTSTKERQAGEGQEAPSAPAGAPNGDFKEQSASKDQEKILADKLAEISKLSTEVESQKKQISTLEEQLNTQKKKNNDLREKNWKAMEALDKAEKSASVKVDSAVKSTREKSQAAVTEVEALDKGILQRLFPEVSVGEKLVHKDWMSEFEKEASVYITTLSSKSSSSSVSESQVKDLETSNSRLLSEVSQYKQLVQDAESKLRQLEKSVESEEKKWQEQLKQAQSQLKSSTSRVSELEQSVQNYQSETEKIKHTLVETEKRLKDSESSQSQGDSEVLQERCYQLEVRVGELEDSNSQYEKQITEYRNVLGLTEEKLTQLEQKAQSEESRWQSKYQQSESDLQQSKKDVESLQEQVKKFRGSTEMEVKVASLESQLKASEDRCLLLQKEAQEAQTQVVTIQSQLEITKQSSDDLEALRRRISELESSLEVEKKKTKDLSMNVVKLNGIIKTGQDALKQEQDSVQKLSEQLNAVQTGSGSGKDVQQAASPANDMGTSV